MSVGYIATIVAVTVLALKSGEDAGTGVVIGIVAPLAYLAVERGMNALIVGDARLRT